jgi:hypothetical protein
MAQRHRSLTTWKTLEAAEAQWTTQKTACCGISRSLPACVGQNLLSHSHQQMRSLNGEPGDSAGFHLGLRILQTCRNGFRGHKPWYAREPCSRTAMLLFIYRI